MPEHIVRAFSEELDTLTEGIARMGGLAESLVSDAISAVVRRDSALAQSVVERDSLVDAQQLEVERKAVRIVALRHPVAQDLRVTLAAFKVSSDLERIGDLAKNVAKRALVLNRSEPIHLTRSIERMGRIVSGRLKQVLDAYAAKESRSALEVWLSDEEVDAHYNSIFRELLTYMMEDPRTISPCAHLLFVAKNIERIGDHCTNMAETIHYMVTGEQVAAERPKIDEERFGDS